jgi:hypothetical protein
MRIAKHKSNLNNSRQACGHQRITEHSMYHSA